MELFAGRPFAAFCVVWVAVAALPALGQSARPEPSVAAAPVVAASGSPQPAVQSPLEPGVFAKINGKTVTQAEFHDVFSDYLRKKYYHGKVPDADLIKAREAVTEQIVDKILLAEEATRRAIVPDAEEVERFVQGFEQRYASSPDWQRDRKSMLPVLRRQIEDQLKVNKLEKMTRESVSAGPAEVLAFYKANPELFTEPERLSLHSIVLGVDPSSPVAVWDAAMVEAQSIVKRIRGGSDFSEIARMVSADPSAQQGGDMGYVHLGMLAEVVQAALATYKPGEVGEPIRFLQGVGIFRIDERIAARLRDFDSVKDRAGELYLREKRDQTWQSFVAALRSKANVEIAEGRPVAASAPNK